MGFSLTGKKQLKINMCSQFSFTLVEKIALKYQKQTYTKPKAASWYTVPGAGLVLCPMTKLSSNRGLVSVRVAGHQALPPEVCVRRANCLVC